MQNYEGTSWTGRAYALGSQRRKWEGLGRVVLWRNRIALRNWTGSGTEQCDDAIETLSLEGWLKVAQRGGSQFTERGTAFHVWMTPRLVRTSRTESRDVLPSEQEYFRVRRSEVDIGRWRKRASHRCWLDFIWAKRDGLDYHLQGCVVQDV